MKKIIIPIITFVIGLTIATVGATILYNANDVSYTSVGAKQNNVQDALDELFENANKSFDKNDLLQNTKQFRNSVGLDKITLELNKGYYLCHFNRSVGDITGSIKSGEYADPNYEITGCNNLNLINENNMFYTGGNPWNSAYLEAVLFTKTFTCNTTSPKTLTISATKDLNSNLIPQILNIECIKIK